MRRSANADDLPLARPAGGAKNSPHHQPEGDSPHRLHRIAAPHAVVQARQMHDHRDGLAHTHRDQTAGTFRAGVHDRTLLASLTVQDDFAKTLNWLGELERKLPVARVTSCRIKKGDAGNRVTRFLADQGVRVSGGHCNPTLDQLRSSIDAGLTLLQKEFWGLLAALALPLLLFEWFWFHRRA